MSTASSIKPRRQYRGMSAEQRRAERHEKLMAAGKEVFGTSGFQAATVRQICNAAGLTERYFYESFKNLPEMFTAVYDRELDRLRDALLMAISQSTGDLEAMAGRGLETYYTLLQEDPQAGRILILEIYGTVPDMERLYRRGVSDFAEIIRGIIDSQFDLSTRRKLNAGLLSTALVGATIHLAMRWILGGYAESRQEMVDNSLAIITAVSEKLGTDIDME